MLQMITSLYKMMGAFHHPTNILMGKPYFCQQCMNKCPLNSIIDFVHIYFHYYKFILTRFVCSQKIKHFIRYQYVIQN